MTSSATATNVAGHHEETTTFTGKEVEVEVVRKSVIANAGIVRTTQVITGDPLVLLLLGLLTDHDVESERHRESLVLVTDDILLTPILIRLKQSLDLHRRPKYGLVVVAHSQAQVVPWMSILRRHIIHPWMSEPIQRMTTIGIRLLKLCETDRNGRPQVQCDYVKQALPMSRSGNGKGVEMET